MFCCEFDLKGEFSYDVVMSGDEKITIHSLQDLEATNPYAVLEIADEVRELSTQQPLDAWLTRRFPQYHFSRPEGVAAQCIEKYRKLCKEESKAVEAL